MHGFNAAATGVEKTALFRFRQLVRPPLTLKNIYLVRLKNIRALTNNRLSGNRYCLKLVIVADALVVVSIMLHYREIVLLPTPTSCCYIIMAHCTN